MILELLLICLLVLFLPLLSKFVENNLEIFLFAMGLLAAVISGVLSFTLFFEAATDPILISIAVLVAGLLLKWLQSFFEKIILGIFNMLPSRLFIGLSIILLGVVSSVITAIIAALVLVIVSNTLKLNRKSQVLFVILSCFSIGLGAALTPIGEPLSTIAIAKLNEEFFYLLKLIGPNILVAILLLGMLGSLVITPQMDEQKSRTKTTEESYDEIINRTLKVYFFVMGLTFLGASFEPLINEYFLGLDPAYLYWVNMISMILDNATLTAAEISPEMNDLTIRAILLGLLISGGMLIPGNIPNIIAANKLKITSKEWAIYGLPIGVIMMSIFYVVLL
jgi:predicted cation transporter